MKANWLHAQSDASSTTAWQACLPIEYPGLWLIS